MVIWGFWDFARDRRQKFQKVLENCQNFKKVQKSVKFQKVQKFLKFCKNSIFTKFRSPPKNFKRTSLFAPRPSPLNLNARKTSNAHFHKIAKLQHVA